MQVKFKIQTRSCYETMNYLKNLQKQSIIEIGIDSATYNIEFGT